MDERHLFPISKNQYFEGILQLRHPSEECIAYIIRQMKHSKNVWLADVKRVKDGYDLFLSSQHHLQGLGKRLQQAFGGVLKVSQKLHTFNRQKSRLVYRVFVYYACPLFKKGEVLLLGDEDSRRPILVRKLQKHIAGIDVISHRTCTFPIYAVDETVIPVQKVRILKVKPRVEIMDPETFQPEPLLEKDQAIEQSSAKAGQWVKAISFKGQWHLLPKSMMQKRVSKKGKGRS